MPLIEPAMWSAEYQPMDSSADDRRLADEARVEYRDRKEGVLVGLAPDFVRGAAAQRLRALGHPDRLRIVESLARRPAHVGELAAALGLSVSTTSRHLRLLRNADVVHCSQRGNHVLYALADRDVPRLAAVAYRGAATQVRRVIALTPDEPGEPSNALEAIKEPKRGHLG